MPINYRTKNHTTVTIALVAVMLSALMIDSAHAQQNQLKANADSMAIAYTNCVTDWVGEHLIASATPTEMAEGAQAKCLNKLQEFEDAQKNYLLSITPPGPQELRAIEKAKSLAYDVREMTKAHVIRLIIETRSVKSAR